MIFQKIHYLQLEASFYLFILFVVSFHLSLLDDNLQTEDLDEKNLFSRGSRRLPELRLVLLGERETGKSSAGNAILGGPGYFQSGEATEECLRQQTEVSNRLVTVVDVPGWEGGPEGLTPERVKREIGLSVTLCPPGPHAFLLALRVDAIIQAQAVREALGAFGEAVWRHTLLLFTRGDQLREESPSSSTSKEEERIFVGWWNDVQTGSTSSAAALVWNLGIPKHR